MWNNKLDKKIIVSQREVLYYTAIIILITTVMVNIITSVLI